jgi:hypothetical protein
MRLAERALHEFRAALELSWWHCYSVRERVVELLGVHADDKGAAGKLKSPSARCAARAVLQAKSPTITSRVAHLMDLLDATITRRNQHTHNLYVGIAFDVGHDSYSPDDVLLQVGQGAKGRGIRTAVATVVRRKARECAAHLQEIIGCLSDLTMVADAELGDPRKFADSSGITQVAFP